jgi:hypothetical protein
MAEVKKKRRGRPRKNPIKKPTLDPKIQHGMIRQYHAPQVKCPDCANQGRPMGTRPYHPFGVIERVYKCTQCTAWWGESRKMGEQ